MWIPRKLKAKKALQDPEGNGHNFGGLVPNSDAAVLAWFQGTLQALTLIFIPSPKQIFVHWGLKLIFQGTELSIS